MPSALYSLRTEGLQYRITKFVDGEPEGSYLVSTDACECPAGHRHTCRHRQMLPQMLAHRLADTHWFFAFDTGGQIVDFNGTSKHLLDQLAEVSRPQEETAKDTLIEGANRTATEIKNTPVPELRQPLIEYLVDQTLNALTVPAGQHCQGSKPWRRL